jgi:hypothetical protein
MRSGAESRTPSALGVPSPAVGGRKGSGVELSQSRAEQAAAADGGGQHAFSKLSVGRPLQPHPWLCLLAYVAYDAARPRPKAPGRIVLSIDGKNVGTPVAFTANTQGAIVMPEFGNELRAGKHTVVLRMEGGSSMPFSMGVKYYSTLPNSAEETKVGIEVSLKDKQSQEEGQSLR